MNESQAITWMDRWARERGQFSGAFPDWVAAKVCALDAAEAFAGVAGMERGIRSVLDVGIGDMAHWKAWPGFPALDWYVGLEGAPAVAEARAAEFPDVTIGCMNASAILALSDCGSTKWGNGPGQYNAAPLLEKRPDALVLLDVLYHIPERELAERLAAWAFRQPDRFVFLSYALPGGVAANEAGCWFPWPRPEIPAGWRSIFSAERTNVSHPQRLEVFARE
jgi:hypothetical protein